MNINLEEITNEVGADACIITDLEGNPVNQINIAFPENIALMTEMAYSMCKGLSEDLNNGELEQLITKTSKGIIIINKFGDYIVLILSNDFSKLGILLKKIKTFETLLRKE